MPFMPKPQLQAFCSSDRDALLTACLGRRTRSPRKRVPAEMLDEIIHDVVGYAIAFQALPGHVLGECDYERRRILVNRRIPELSMPNTKIVGVMNSVKAHELGHTRFPHHEREVREELARRLAGGSDEIDEAALEAEESREMQAHYYARQFLIPEPMLGDLEDACVIEEAWRQGGVIASVELWPMVLRLADHFLVTGTLMVRRLEGLGWIRLSGADRQLSISQPSCRSCAVLT